MSFIVKKDSKNEQNERILAKYKAFLKITEKGIFTRKKRGKILGIDNLPGREKQNYDFWYDVRKSIKLALRDLELFIEGASKNQISQVISKETVEPIVVTYFWTTNHGEPDYNKAEIANLFINWGFEYLKSTLGGRLTLSHKRTVEEALDLSEYLTGRCKHLSELD